MNDLSDLKLVAIYLIAALLITTLEGPIFIPLLHRFKFGQPIRDEGPKSHMKKAGTPTMGGIMFIVAVLITMIFRAKDFTSNSIIALFSLVAFGIIGFLDDALKIIKKQNEGLKSIQKMILLIFVSVLIGVYMVTSKDISTDIFIPFIGKYITLAPSIFIIFTIIYFAAVTNAVNLTDGLDGLSTTVSILVITFFNIIALATSQIDIVIFSSILIGALLGFLRLNAYPAKIFMGDTGSLALGGAIGAIAMLLNLQIILIVVGGIYVFETLSVIIQVTYYKKTKKRFFKMAPVHHHFEAIGWHETKIVSVFSIVTVVLCAIGFLIL